MSNSTRNEIISGDEDEMSLSLTGRKKPSLDISVITTEEGDEEEADDETESNPTTPTTVIDGFVVDDSKVAIDNEGGGQNTDNSTPNSKSKGERKRERNAARLKKKADKEIEWEETPFESLAARAERLEARRKINDDYVADLRHKGLHSISGDIDRCLKKVSDGLETFEDVWQMVHSSATNTNQKKKCEGDLKIEIKKLVRLRDQIKSWMASGEIKDKSTLIDTRKLIEMKMELFKRAEKGIKIKAYSRKGLGATQELDQTTKEREKLNNWLITSIDALQLQIDQFESEVESILAAKKKRLDKDKQDRLDELKNSLERHRFHVTNLETLMRMLDNLAADVNGVNQPLQLRTFLSQVKKIKDDIDYYLDSNQEPEFEENEFIYDDIDGLEDFDDGLVGQPGARGTEEEGEIFGSQTSITSGNNSSMIFPVHSSSDASDSEKRRKSLVDSAKVVRPDAMKANQSNHSPSSVVKSMGAIGTPPKSGTPNNSSPSSGLSNHVSSLSSLSSSPTHNYHNALNNSKTIVHSTESTEHNSSSSLTGTSSIGFVSKSPATTNSTSILEGITTATVNGVLENGNASPNNNEDHSSPHTQLITSSSSSVIGSTTLENGLISPTPSQETSNNINNQLLNSSLIGSSNDRSQNLQMKKKSKQKRQLFGDSVSSSTESNSTSQPQQQQQQQTSSFLPTFNGLGGAAGISNNLSEGFTSNMDVSSSNSLISNSSNSSSALGGSANVIGLGGIHNSAACDLLSSSPLLIPSTTSSPWGVTSFATSNSINSPSANNGGVSSHNNSSSGILSQQHIQHLQHLQQNQGSSSQSGTSLDSTSMSEYLRLQSQEQILLPKNLSIEPELIASLKSMDLLDKQAKEAHIPPLLGAAPLGPVPLQKEHQVQFQYMEAAHCHLPVPADSERMREILPRNPYPTPHYYPQHPLSNSDACEFFQRLSIEILFFIFYYLEGTKAQIFAANVLKEQTWRFHTKYFMWFQRHDEPKVINDEYEQGTYLFFDIENWEQRKVDGFIFEYKYLEDRDLVPGIV